MDFWSLPLDRALNVLWGLFAENRDEKDRFKLWSQIDQPTSAQIARMREDIWLDSEADAAAFAAAERSGLF